MRRDGLASHLFLGILQAVLIDPIRFRTKGMTSRIPQGNTDYTSGVQSDPAQHGGGRGLDGPAVRGWEGPYLLGGCVLHSVGVVVIIDDVQILHRFAREGTAELHIQRGFSGPFGVDSEVGWFPIFHTWKDKP